MGTRYQILVILTEYGMALDTKIKLEGDNGINLGMTFLGLERYYLRLTNAAVISILPLDRLFNSYLHLYMVDGLWFVVFNATYIYIYIYMT
jgi:hypothetical protein